MAKISKNTFIWLACCLVALVLISLLIGTVNSDQTPAPVNLAQDIASQNPEELFDWIDEDDPQELGFAVNEFIGNFVFVDPESAELLNIDESSMLSDEENQQLDEAAILISPFLDDQTIERFLFQEQKEPYRLWRNEHFDAEGNSIKDIQFIDEEIDDPFQDLDPLPEEELVQ